MTTFLKNLSRTYWRESLVPAAAVIPAPAAYANVAEAERLVVDYRSITCVQGDIPLCVLTCHRVKAIFKTP